jgi:SNF2 family DNA or RNA helicase
VIINQENVAWLVKTHFNDLASFDMIVVDESSAYKSPKSQRFKALKKLKDTGMIQRWVLLTATPTPNSLLEAWSQMYLLDKGDRLGRTFYAYQSRYFESDYMGYSWTPRAFSEDFIRAQISALAVVVENYSGLPDRFDITEPVYLKPRDYDTYKQLETDALIELDDGDITAVNAAVLAGKLQQLASGAVYNEAKEVVHYHDAKLDVLEDLLTQAEGENVIVAYQYKHEYDRLKHRFPHAVSIKEPNAVTDWNKGNIKLLLAQPQSCSHGLNLQDGGRRIIWFTPTWSNEQKLQMDARLYRQGQNDHVFVHTLVTTDTVDELIMEAVNTKKTLQEALILAVKQAKGIAAVA